MFITKERNSWVTLLSVVMLILSWRLKVNRQCFHHPNSRTSPILPWPRSLGNLWTRGGEPLRLVLCVSYDSYAHGIDPEPLGWDPHTELIWKVSGFQGCADSGWNLPGEGEQGPHKTGKTSSRGWVSPGTSQDGGGTSNFAKIISKLHHSIN